MGSGDNISRNLDNILNGAAGTLNTIIVSNSRQLTDRIRKNSVWVSLLLVRVKSWLIVYNCPLGIESLSYFGCLWYKMTDISF